MQGTIKFFHEKRGWGFLTSEDKDYFVHYSQIKMSGRKILSSDDIVNFDISVPDEAGKVQAVNVQPVLTREMIADALKEENLHIKTINTPKETKYLVVDENEVIQSGEHGLTFLDLAAFAGFSICEE